MGYTKSRARFRDTAGSAWRRRFAHAQTETKDCLIAMQGSPSQPDRKHESHWEVVNGFLAVREVDGTITIPSADKVYRARVEGSSVPGLPPIDGDASFSVLSFSRFPLRLAIIIEAGTDNATSPLRVTVLAIDQKMATPFPALCDETPDHIVVEHRWYPLVPGSLDEVRQTLQKAGISAPGPITLRQYLALRSLASDHTIICDQSGEAASAYRQEATLDVKTGPLFVGTLFPYQKNGLRWLTTITSQEIGGILADDMGLGKTIQILALIATESFERRVPSVVVAPSTLLENWRREIARFAPSLRALIHSGAGRTGFPSELSTNDVVLTSYDTLIRDLSLFRTIDWNIVVLDEAQAIKNPKTRRASAVRRLPRRVGIAVTGTPVENRLRDLWSITDFAVPGFLGTQAGFESTFQDDAHAAESLAPLVSPILLRRRVTDVANDLPERIEIPQALELDQRQAEAYDAIRQAIVDEYGDRATLVALTRLRMFCTHPNLVGSAENDPTAESTKYQRLTEILEEIFSNAEKAVLFTSFNKMSDLAVVDISLRFGVCAFSIDGRTPIEDRLPTVDKFSDTVGGAVLVLNPRAAGTGLNITAANHVIHYNLEWNPAIEDQASARVYRTGQTRPVTVHRLFYVNTVEEIIDERLKRKRNLAATAVVGTDGSNDGLEDILDALKKSPVRSGPNAS